LIESIFTLISAGTELGVQQVHSRSNGRWAGNQEPIVTLPDWVSHIGQKNEQFLGYSNAGRIIDIAEDLASDPDIKLQKGDIVLSSGNHASHVVESPCEKPVVVVPNGVRADHAAFGVLGSVALYGIERSGLELGKTVAILGMGVVGQLSLQLAKYTGCEILAAIDLVDMRLETAGKGGATHLLNPAVDSFRDDVRKMTAGRGFDVIIEASGAIPAIPLAVELAAIGGRVLLLGSPWSRSVHVDFFDIHLKELHIIGCHQPRCPTQPGLLFPWTQSYNRSQILKMIADGRLNVERLITHRLPFAQAEEAYRKLRDEKSSTLGIVLDWQSTT
jgi:2-desacetyl-2-hydroxyethyl bacteriochlorophyllide A dehydrogenase